MPLSITIDGPVGAGKSTVADEIAKRLSILHLDTGAMYRAFAYACLSKNIPVEDIEGIKTMIDNTDISVEFADGVQQTLINGINVNDKIRSPEISMNASTLSKLPFVREKLVNEQRKIALTKDMVLDGRDTGTNVLKNASFKIYLTASPETRAMRRFKQGLSQDSFETILEAVKKRDHQDMTRELNPLEQAEDAFLVDSSNLTQEETVEAILNIVRDGNYGKQ